MSELWQAVPEDIRTTILIVAAVGGLLLGLYVVGRLLTWRRRDSPLPILLVIGGLGVLVGGVSLYLDAQPTVPGVVEAKAERIDVDDEGAWSHELTVRVRYTRPDTGTARSDDLGADPAIYDRVSTGDRVDVRFLHVGGLISFARLSDRSTLSMLLGAATNPTFVIMLAIAGLFALLWLLSTRPEWKVGFRTAFVLLFAVALVVQFLPQWRASRPLRGTQATAVATVREVDRFTQVGGSDESEPAQLIQPFDLVEVTFVPADWREPVLAADIVDADSLSLEQGGSVRVHYLEENPRTIRLEGGTRTYAWKNVLWSMGKAAAVLLVIAVYLFGRRFWRRLAPRVATGPSGMAGG
ncbi:MAG: hypothetical protein RRC07_09580 [Anaerolineae bacterium]|nr:hypothetical protein [Anaerolineae bacterium]